MSSTNNDSSLFDGERDEPTGRTFFNFLEITRLHMRLDEVKDDERKIIYFIKDFTLRFLPPDAEYILERAFYEARQTTSVSEYNREFGQIVLYLPKPASQYALSRYILGLQDDIQFLVLRGHPTILRDAMYSALSVEKLTPRSRAECRGLAPVRSAAVVEYSESSLQAEKAFFDACQTKPIREYNAEFRAMLAKAPEGLRSRAMNRYIMSLLEDIELYVRRRHPTTLEEAMRFAEDREKEYIAATRRTTTTLRRPLRASHTLSSRC